MPVGGDRRCWLSAEYRGRTLSMRVIASIRFEVDDCPELTVVEEQFEFRLVGRHIHVRPVSPSHPQWNQLTSDFWKHDPVLNPEEELDKKCVSHKTAEKSYMKRKICSEKDVDYPRSARDEIKTSKGLRNDQYFETKDTEGKWLPLAVPCQDSSYEGQMNCNQCTQYFKEKEREKKSSSRPGICLDAYFQKWGERFNENDSPFEPSKLRTNNQDEDLIKESLKQFKSGKSQFPWESNTEESSTSNVRYPTRFSLGQAKKDNEKKSYPLYFDELEKRSVAEQKFRTSKETVKFGLTKQERTLSLYETPFDKVNESSMKNNKDPTKKYVKIEKVDDYRIKEPLNTITDASETIERPHTQIEENNFHEEKIEWSLISLTSHHGISASDPPFSSVISLPLEENPGKAKEHPVSKENASQDTLAGNYNKEVVSTVQESEALLVMKESLHQEDEGSRMESQNQNAIKKNGKVSLERSMNHQEGKKMELLKTPKHPVGCLLSYCAQKEKLKLFYRYYEENQHIAKNSTDEYSDAKSDSDIS